MIPPDAFAQLVSALDQNEQTILHCGREDLEGMEGILTKLVNAQVSDDLSELSDTDLEWSVRLAVAYLTRTLVELKAENDNDESEMTQ